MNGQWIKSLFSEIAIIIMIMDGVDCVLRVSLIQFKL